LLQCVQQHHLCFQPMAPVDEAHQENYFSEIFKMRITASLNKKIIQAVQTSMQIEGYKSVQSPSIKEQVKALMEQHRVQVSVQRK